MSCRLGEMARTPELAALQDMVLAECLAVAAAELGSASRLEAGLAAQIKAHSRSKFSRPSMLQAVHAGKRTEIDALNGEFVAAGARLGIPTPYNAAVVALVKGVERCAITRREQPQSSGQGARPMPPWHCDHCCRGTVTTAAVAL